MTPGSAQFRMTYEISPIMMTGGIAGNVPGATVPLIAFTEGGGFGNILGAGSGSNLDSFFAYFYPIAGSRLANNAVGTYPFANQSVAANAIITSPLSISMIMICPAKLAGDYSRRNAIITALKQTLDSHVLAGGLFSVATPAFLYTDCILTNFMDASAGETKQAQYRFQLDFIQPLVSKQQAQQSYNNMMAKINSQTEFTPSATPWSMESTTVGNPASGAAPAAIPGTRTDPGNGFAPSSFTSSTAADQNVFPDFAGTPDTAVSSFTTFAEPTPAAKAISTAGELNIPTAVY